MLRDRWPPAETPLAHHILLSLVAETGLPGLAMGLARLGNLEQARMPTTAPAPGGAGSL